MHLLPSHGRRKRWIRLNSTDGGMTRSSGMHVKKPAAWFQKELALSYIERGFTQKAYDACEKAYGMGCRDLDFVLMYTVECDEYGSLTRELKFCWKSSIRRRNG